MTSSTKARVGCELGQSAPRDEDGECLRAKKCQQEWRSSCQPVPFVMRSKELAVMPAKAEGIGGLDR